MAGGGKRPGVAMGHDARPSGTSAAPARPIAWLIFMSSSKMPCASRAAPVRFSARPSRTCRDIRLMRESAQNRFTAVGRLRASVSYASARQRSNSGRAALRSARPQAQYHTPQRSRWRGAADHHVANRTRDGCGILATDIFDA